MRIGRLELAAPFCQAGLAGYSDMPMRVVARRRGCQFALTEAMSDEMVAQGGRAVRRRLAVRDDDHPLAGQIMGSEPEMMARAARVLVELGYDAVDVNVACPVRKQARPRGGHLLARPELAVEVLARVRDAVPAEVPLTVKLRRGTDDSPLAAERFARIFAGVWEHGYDAACVHGRTVEQVYRGIADWAFLAALKRAHPERVILGSGDLYTAADAVRMLRETGMDGVWLARGAIGNPWIFAQAAQAWAGAPVEEPGVAAQAAALREHLALIGEGYPAEQVAGRMRGVMFRYARLHPDAEAVKKQALACVTRADVDALIARWDVRVSPVSPAAAPAVSRA